MINAETWPDDANANLRFLKRDVGQLIMRAPIMRKLCRKELKWS